MNIALWILQILLAIVFLLHGLLYVIWPSAIVERMESRPGVPPIKIPPLFRTFIGVAEILAAIGLILPGLTGILPWLTPLAAAGLMIVMVGAVIYHLRRQEGSTAIALAVLFLLITFVTYMRWQVLPL